MILKLKIPADTKICGWRLIDKIKKVDYEFVKETDVLKKNAEAIGIQYINIHKTVIDSPVVKNVAAVWITFDNNNIDMFYTDETVFIMNNEGKTCDTIQAVVK